MEKSYLTGYVTVLIKGSMSELFFQDCMNHGIPVWNVKKTSETSCQGNVKLRDIHIIKKINRTTNYKISFIDRKGYPFFIKRFRKKKELILALLISLLLIVFLSNILWKITILGVSKEMEEKISKQLTSYGVHLGSWVFTLDSPSAIQQKLVVDLPELLWVGVQKKGTTFTLEGVEKTIVKKEDQPGPRNLIATKKGVIKKIYVSHGQPKVRVNDFVKPGKVLVSGVLNEELEPLTEVGEEERVDDRELVAAKGVVIAQTWYEVIVNIPLKINNEILTGNQAERYYLGIGNVQLPIWGFGSSGFSETHVELNENPLYLLKWKLPIHVVESISSEKMYTSEERTKEEAIEIGIIQAKRDLQLELGPDAQILTEDILHETIENGKVKLHLYITVEEDITKIDPIIRGD